MAESGIFERLSRDLGIARGSRETPEHWHCRLVYSVATVRGLASLWEQEEGQEEEGVSLQHVAAVMEQTLMSFRKLFPYVEKALASFEDATNEGLQVQIRDVLQRGGCFYHRSWRAAPTVRSCAFANGISFLRGLRPGKTCPMSGAGFYRKGESGKANRDVFSMFGLQALLSRKELVRLGESLNEVRRDFPEDREFLRLHFSRSGQKYWKEQPDRDVLSLMRRKEGNSAYTLYRFDGKTFYCRVLPEYWNEHPRYAALAAALLAQRGLTFFDVKHEDNLVFVKPDYLLPPAVEAFFRLYSWPDLDPSQKERGYYAFRIMAGEVYPAFHDVMTRLGYRFEERSYV